MASLNYSTSSENDQVLIEDKKYARVLVLNRPKLLNALSPYMVSRLLELFLAYEEDPGVKLIILKGNGRAFCAGGDVVAVVNGVTRDWRFGSNFTWKQYGLKYVMATYRKPQVSILDGIVMGAGAGVSAHGRFRVATENTVFAMPETAVGLFPDVGASYFLSRLPGFFGEYLGLTGAKLDGAEMLACGLATHFVPSMKLAELEGELCKTDSSDAVHISEIIDRFAEQPVIKQNSVYHQLHIIDKCFSRTTVEEILCSLETEAAKMNAAWISATINSLKKASPTSLKISLRSIREGRHQGIDQCLVCEYRIYSHLVKADVNRDAIEGCQAMFIRKDRNPEVQWEPSRLDLVTDSMVNRYFSRVEERDWQDLKFPLRSGLRSSAMAKL